MDRRSWLKLSAAFGAAMFGMVSGAQAQDTIKVGELNSYKNFAAFLEPYKKGMELAVDEINASGGVLGKKFEIVSRDDTGNTGEAVRLADELMTREKTAFLIGTFPSTVGLAVARYAKEHKALFIAPEPLPAKTVRSPGNKNPIPPPPP